MLILNGNFQNIDNRLLFDSSTRKWSHNTASYKPIIPEFSDDWFEFFNRYEGANHTIKARPVASHVKGVYAEEPDGSVAVTYPEAFGKGIDLKVYSYWAGLKKVVVINEKPFVLSDMTFDFELSLPVDINFKVKTQTDSEIDVSKDFDFTDKTIKLGEVGKESYFRNALMWDSNGLSEKVGIKLLRSGGKLFIRKTIPQAFLEKAVFPVYTDHPTSYYVGTAAGDGDVRKESTTWSVSHNATSGIVNKTASTGRCLSALFSGTYTIRRTFVPIDTSGINDSDTITAAVLNLYVTAKTDTGNDANDWFNVVQTSQASTSDLVVDDYDNCGSVSNPTEGATRLDIDGITTSAYNTWTLDSTGIGWIDKIGITKLGLREGHDALNSAVDDSEFIDITWATTEDTSGTKDPYLDVTTGGAIIATPSLASISVLIFAASAIYNISQIATHLLTSINILAFTATATSSSSVSSIATPSLASVSLLINSATQAFNSSATATPSVATVSILPQTATQVYTASKTASPSLAEASIVVFSATAVFSGAGIVIALPSLASISITSPIPLQTFSASRIASPSLSSVSITAYTPAVSSGAVVTASPSTSFLSILLNSPTVSFQSNIIASPSVSLISINPYSATATFGVSGQITTPYRLESLMEKQINKESRINKYINIESTLVN